MSDDHQLTDSEIAELRANRKERDHWKWLIALIRRSALWIVAAVAGVHTLTEKLGDLVTWLRPK